MAQLANASLYSPPGMISHLRKDTPTRSPQNCHDEKASAGSCVAIARKDVTAVVPKSVLISPIIGDEWESFPPLHFDLTSEGVTSPFIIDDTHCYDEDDDDHDDGKVTEEQNPPASAQSFVSIGGTGGKKGILSSAS